MGTTLTRELPEHHQECIQMLAEGGWEVQQQIEQLLELKRGTLNHLQWTRIVGDH